MEIKNSEKIIPDAYHGTSLVNAKNIIEAGKFKIGRNKSLYLGDGIYFYEGAQSSAEWWAKNNTQVKSMQIGVIKAEVKLGRCFDLINNETHKKSIESTRQKLMNRMDIKKILEKLGVKTLTEPALINFLAQELYPNQIDSVVACKPRGLPKFFNTNSRFLENIETMICLKTNEMILGMNITWTGIT